MVACRGAAREVLGLRQDHAVAGAVGARGERLYLLFEALGFAACCELPVRQAANRCGLRQRLWRRARHYVEVARAKDDMSGVRHGH